MDKLHVEFGFKGKARLKQVINLLFKRKVKTYLLDSDILQIWKQYCDHQKQPVSKQKAK